MHTIIKQDGYYMCAENTLLPGNTPACLNNNSYTDGYSFTTDGWKRYMDNLGFKMLDYYELQIAYHAVPTSLYLYRKIDG
jgi:hypothetical protein